MPIYARTFRDICIKKPGRKAKHPVTIHVMGDLASLVSGKVPLIKYGDPSHPMVTVQLGKTIVSRVLVDLGAAINFMTLETAQLLHLKNLIRETPTILELSNHSTIKIEVVIEDLIISVDSWNYPADFVVLQTKAKLGGLLGPYNTNDYPITIVVVPLINIFVPLLSPYLYYCAP